jgi:hypothetical protein
LSRDVPVWGAPSLPQRRSSRMVRDSAHYWKQLEPKPGKQCLEGFENMVARDGIEPPTPAFSGLPNQQLTDTFNVVS